MLMSSGLTSSESEGSYEILEEGPVSTVSRTWTKPDGGEPLWLVTKTSMMHPKFSKEPHDIVKELRILSSLSHPNIIPVIDHFCDTELSTLNIWMPYIPISLSQILTSPSFSPFPLGAGESAEEKSNRLQTRFDTVTKSIMYQTLSGVTYLHNDMNRVAHRDIKPNNILITLDGRVQLIDFGIAWRDGQDAMHDDLWPEDSNRMYFEVSTGPYRAPELLFGTRSYDAFAIDLWSLGATFAEIFTALKLCSEGYYEDEPGDNENDDSGLNDDQKPKPFIIPNNMRIGTPETRWFRTTLFNSERGEIGLAWSIFKIRGTPTAENWPEFSNLPDAKGVTFNATPTVPLAPLLPHLPRSSLSACPREGKEDHHFPSDTMSPSALDLISRFLVYPSHRRLKAAQALSHPWFADEILVPVGYPFDEKCTGKSILQFEDKSLGQWLQMILLQE